MINTYPHYRAIAIPIGDAIFVNSLLSEVPKHTQAISPPAVVSAGAENLRKEATNSTILRALQLSYSNAVTDTIYLALATVCLALFFACGMEWKNIKKVAEERKKAEEDQNQLGSDVRLTG